MLGVSPKVKIGDYEISCIDGKCETSDGVLGGSALDLASAIRNSVQRCNIPLDEAIRMATLYPAEALGIDKNLGTIEIGKFADFAIINGQVYVEAIVRRGNYMKF